MDGYAVRAADLDQGPGGERRIRVAGRSLAGDPVPGPLPPGSAWEVATGGPVPAGADSVIRIEDTDRGHPVVTIRSLRDLGQHLRPAGGDAAEGAVLLDAGIRLGAGGIALLAAGGAVTVTVRRQPAVAILCTGDELADLRDGIDPIAARRRIPDVNGPMLEAAVREAGAVPLRLGIAGDDDAAVTPMIAGLDPARADMIVSAGGISVGDRDRVAAAMDSTGGRRVFRRVRIRPGGPVTLAVLPDGRPWLALPGNPVSALVTFHLIARPMLAAMAGDARPVAGECRMVMEDPLEPLEGLERYPRVRLSGAGSVRLTGPQESWRTTGLGIADGVIRVEAGHRIRAGDEVAFLPWSDFRR